MKKKLLLIFIFVLSLLTLIGCGEEKDPGKDPVNPQPQEHVCAHVCPTCGKCTDANCTDPACADKCQGHNQQPGERTMYFDYEWEDEEWDGEQAFTDGEGNNFMIKDGKACTIDKNGKIGYASSWTYGYGPYDQGIGECVIEAKFTHYGTSVDDEPAIFSIRHLYALLYDVQINLANNGKEAFVGLYNVSTGTKYASSTKVSTGGQNTKTQFAINEEHIMKIIYHYTGESTTDMFVVVDDVLELYVHDLPKQDVNAKFGFGCNKYSNVQVDYFKCYSLEESDYAGFTPLNPEDYVEEHECQHVCPVCGKCMDPNCTDPKCAEKCEGHEDYTVINPTNTLTSKFASQTIFKSWDFNEAGKTGAEVLGDAYVEGTGLLTDNQGYLRTVAGEGIIAAAPGWSSSRTPYDMNVPMNYILEAKLVALTETTAVIRSSHAIYCDFQLHVTPNDGEAGVYIYKSGSEWAKFENLTVKPGEEHILAIEFIQEATSDATTNPEQWGVYTVNVYVDNVLVGTIENAVSAGPAASMALAVTGGECGFDYFNIYEYSKIAKIDSKFAGTEEFKNWDFNEAGKTGAEVLGDAYVEGTGLLTDSEGYLCTVSEGTTIGAAPGWSSSRTPYDMNVPMNYILETKFIALTEATAVIRSSHAIYCDFQLHVTPNDGEAGVYIYKSGAEWAKFENLTVKPNAEHILAIEFIQEATSDATTNPEQWGVYTVNVYVDNVLVGTIENAVSAGPAASMALAVTGGNVKFDYFKIYKPLVSKFANNTVVKAWEFNEEAGKTGAEVLGDAYVEGTGLLTDGEGHLCTVSEGTTIGAAPGWSSSRTPYDMNIPASHIFEVMFEAKSTGVAVIRGSHAIYCDFQLVISDNDGEAGVYAYKSGAEWAKFENLTVKPGKHILSVEYIQESTSDATTNPEQWGVYTVNVYVDNVLVGTIENTVSFGPAASYAVAVNGGNIAYDYFRIYNK